MKYLLTVKIPLEGIDDVDARGQGERLGKYLKEAVKSAQANGMEGVKPEYKLQKLNEGKPPEKIDWEIEKTENIEEKKIETV